MIINVNFHGEDLTRADFNNAKIESANWDNCIMEGAKLNGVELIQFDLEDPNIIEMLAEADLEYADWTGVSDEMQEILRGAESLTEDIIREHFEGKILLMDKMENRE